jgi:hypothetical protein
MNPLLLSLAFAITLGCGSQATVSPYADSPGEGGGTWLVTGFCATSGIAANDTDLFFVTCNDVGHAGRQPRRLEDYRVLDDAGDVMAIAIDADSLYVAASMEPPHAISGRGVVYRQSISSGQREILASGQNAVALAIDDSYVYWIDAPKRGATDATSNLMAAPKTGGTTMTIANQLPEVVALTVDGATVYLATDDAILAVAKDGSAPPATIAAAQAHPTAIAADGGLVYWTTTGPGGAAGGALFSIAAGGTSVQTLATDLSYPTSVALDATRVYFTSLQTGQTGGVAEGGTVMSLPREGGERKTLGWGQGYPLFLAATPSALYWTDTEGDSLTSGTVKVAE